MADADIEPASGSIYFTSNQAAQNIAIQVKADALPEISEVRMKTTTLGASGSTWAAGIEAPRLMPMLAPLLFFSFVDWRHLW